MDAKIIQQPFRTLLTSISNQSQISQPETKLTHDPLDDHTSEEVLTTKKTVSQGLQPGCQRSTTASPAFGLAVAGGSMPSRVRAVNQLATEKCEIQGDLDLDAKIPCGRVGTQ
jgi:hypothetical protein